MPHLLIRILVAIATFGVGLAASALWAFFTPAQNASAPTTTVTETRLVVVRSGEPAAAGPSAHALQKPRTATVSGGILNEKAVLKAVPDYPEIAERARVEGQVVVRIVVDERGDVSTALAESGHPLLQQAAVNAVREWKFTPTRLSGQPVKVSGLVTVNFTLE
ncbi:MAG TPA: energy transducer TonB [Pyrinomonadaceae bacterium]|nr:energy transducer TonB [Pyrinomonadaceae bacterium]